MSAAGTRVNEEAEVRRVDYVQLIQKETLTVRKTFYSRMIRIDEGRGA